jgi:hypothetical protein
LHRQTRRLLPQLAWNALTECMAASGPRSAARRVAWRIRWHKLAAQVRRWNRARLEPHYRELWRLYSIHERLLALADEGAETERWLDVCDEPQFVADDLEGAVIGLHDRETYMNQSFRWTQPISVWRLRGLSAERRLHFRTHAVRGDLTPSELTVCCNGKPVPTSKIDLSPDGLTIDLADSSFGPTKPTTLLLSIPALRPWRQGRPDRRALGLPMISVGFLPSTAWVQKSAA